ncbi:GTPase [uncultured Brachyspira sp.]|uniref:GTPase n=1 Tax=uncultured Brachyspira sp. TaxID=221953 RepID=UPI002593C53B|nr:GTPase [uncultured Brachyspira sp.]
MATIKEKNLKEIEEFFKGIEVYSIEKIKENKINNVVENTAKEKIMSNNDELTLNLLILGQTGVGKSSLINALLGKKVAKAGLGKPISTHIQEYKTELDGKKVNLYNSMGFEVKNEKCIDDIKNALKERSADKDIKDWFHSVTYCIQAGGLKIQDFDIKMIKQFVDEKYNVIIALTKSDQLGKAKREEFIEIIKKGIKEATKKDIMVITVAGDPEQLDHMTEKPKPYGLEEYKAAILISWREIFINRIPVHIVKKLKEDIENAKKNAPRKGKDKELSNKIQEYFSNILNANTQKYVRESIEKYYKITADILASSKNINLSNKKLNLNSHYDEEFTKEMIEMYGDFFSNFGDFDFGDRVKIILAAPLIIPIAILEFSILKPLGFLIDIMEKGDKIEKFINDVSEEYTKKIGEEEFESEIRKIIINNLNEIDKK